MQFSFNPCRTGPFAAHSLTLVAHDECVQPGIKHDWDIPIKYPYIVYTCLYKLRFIAAKVICRIICRMDFPARLDSHRLLVVQHESTVPIEGVPVSIHSLINRFYESGVDTTTTGEIHQ